MSMKVRTQLRLCSLFGKYFRYAVTCAAVFLLVPVCAVCKTDPAIAGTNRGTPGIAWNVKGSWQVEGAQETLRTGDAIEPGTLLHPSIEDTGHSITILLPDGQQILYECFTAKDCARGFIVPELFRTPDPSVADMLARIRAVLIQERSQASPKPADEPPIAQEEAVAVLGPGDQIELGGLAGKLPNGEYSGDLRSFDGRFPEQSGIPLEKSGKTIAMTVPGPGLYLLRIMDRMKWPRVDLMIAVVATPDSSVARDFQKERALLAEWKEDFFGWPTHAFQRAYLQSLVLGIQPAPGGGHHAESSNPRRPGITAEPTIAPRPGLFNGDIAITLQCATPGAVIHYTLGGSQPMENSPVYRAPIIAKNMPITIKAYAEAAQKKDSAVVTGNFRIEEH